MLYVHSLLRSVSWFMSIDIILPQLFKLVGGSGLFEIPGLGFENRVLGCLGV